MAREWTDQSIDELIKKRLDEILPERIESALSRRREQTPGSMTIIVTRGTLDGAYPPFILASTAAALGWQVSIFFTFYGLLLLRKDISDLKLSPLGNPAMPMKMPIGPGWLRSINWSIPNAIQSTLPGFEALASAAMRRTLREKGIATLPELRKMAIDAGVNLIGCQMTVDLFGLARGDLIPEVTEYVGAASYLSKAREADVSLFI
jgi:peroxiredoxin family protein